MTHERTPDLFHSLASLRPMRGAMIVFAASALLLAACSSSASPSATASGAATSCTKAENGVVKMSAENLAFDTTCIEVPAGQAFKIEFTNKDTAPHDVAIWDSSSKGKNLFTGEPVSEQNKTVTYDVPALEAGEHYFECTIHPTMNGKVVAQ